MDVPLYAIALTLFAVLYLAIGVFLAYALILTLMIMFLYLVLRYGNMPDDYPYSNRDITITMIFIGITWSIFTFLAPKSPIPFVGSGFTYTAPASIPVDSIIIIAFFVAIAFLVIFSFLPRDQSPGGAPMGGSGGQDKPKQGVGAG
jgi:phosphatidylglycerophosphate synthase